MENNNQPKPDEKPNDSSLADLESESTIVADGSDSTSIDPNSLASGTADDSSAKKPKNKKAYTGVKGLADKLNIYLLLFILVLIIAGVVAFVSFQKSKDASKKQSQPVSTTPLSEQDLEKLRQTDVKVGDPKQILSVESNAIFAGKVLIRDSLEVAGAIKVGGPLNLPGISVSGASIFDQVQINNLKVNSSATINGQLGIQGNTAVSGNLTVGGTISAGRLNIEVMQINQDLQLSKHIDAGGGTPTSSSGGALGGGGTASLSGTDTAGTININTGGGTSAGCFINVNFSQKFSSPHVVITPVGGPAGALNYYINRSPTGFSVCTSNPAPVGQNFAFDYIVID